MFSHAAFRACSSPLLTRTRPALIAFGLSIPFLQPRPVTRFDASPAASDFSTSAGGYLSPKDVKTPLTRNGALNPAAVKQISFGSILGLGAGLLLSAFSRSLTLLLGVSIVFWQYLERKGYHIIPVDKVQQYVKGFDVRSAIYDNVAFKTSFGLVFALTAFAEF
ncbi:hypothetical protein DV738_g1038, partial [Chaetothyriales sp. CBS 135597]